MNSIDDIKLSFKILGFTKKGENGMRIKGWIALGVMAFSGLELPISYANNPERLTDFYSLVAAIRNGYTVTAHADFTYCVPGTPVEGYIVLPRAIITATSLRTFQYNIRIDHPLYPGTPVGEAVSYNLTNDGTLTITNVLYDPTTFTPESSQPPGPVVCLLGSDVEFYAH